MTGEPLTPLAFLDRARAVHGSRTAVIDGPVRLTYAELWERSRRLAGFLTATVAGAPVAVLAPNTHAMLEAHFAAPLAGSPLVALNIRLTAPELAYILGHSGTALLLCDDSLLALGHEAAGLAGCRLLAMGGADDELEAAIGAHEPAPDPAVDEHGLFSINYTSGTTGRPKGVMYHHRGVYLQSLAMIAHLRLGADSRMLWTLPMFHCHGWCFVYALTAVGGTHVCQRRFDGDDAWRLIGEETITHLNGAPAVLASLAASPVARPLTGPRLRVGTGGAPPAPALLSRLSALGIDVTHLYGLTETFGPAVVNDWHPEWDARSDGERARLMARQGVSTVVSCPVRVVDENGADVPADGCATGEVAIRGNNVMMGYYRDEEGTARAIPDGWFRTGDVAVMHPDGYIELKDRSKDIIISGGENISSIEVEQALASHPAVFEVAVIAMPDPRWGEVPAAYVALHPGAQVDENALIAHARERLAHFKAPKAVVFGELPKTATGKVQKFLLREAAWAGHEKRIG